MAVDLPVAQRLSGKQRMVDEIDVAARPGVPVPALISAIRGIAPATAKVTTAAEQARTATADVGQQYDLLRYVLLGCASIALLVGAFIIVNTMSIRSPSAPGNWRRCARSARPAARSSPRSWPRAASPG
jgi:hypothetical protein